VPFTAIPKWTAERCGCHNTYRYIICILLHN